MKSMFAASLCVAIVTGVFAATHGAWTAVPDDKGEVHLSMTRGTWQQMGVTSSLAELGLNPSAMQATTSTPVTLRLQRDAGTIVLEGSFKDGYGAGQFTFTPNRGYIDALRSAGVAFDISEGKSEEDQLFLAAVIDVSVAYVRSMRQLFPGATYHDLKKARAVDVTPKAIAGLRSAGVAIDDLHTAIRLRAVGVTPQFVAELAAAGYEDVSTRDLVRLAATGVDGEFIRKMSNVKRTEKK